MGKTLDTRLGFICKQRSMLVWLVLSVPWHDGAACWLWPVASASNVKKHHVILGIVLTTYCSQRTRTVSQANTRCIFPHNIRSHRKFTWACVVLGFILMHLKCWWLFIVCEEPLCRGLQKFRVWLCYLGCIHVSWKLKYIDKLQGWQQPWCTQQPLFTVKYSEQ